MKIRKRKKRQAKVSVKKLLDNFTKFDIKKSLLLSLSQIVYISEPEIFDEIAEAAKDIRIKNYEILNIKLYSQNVIFGYIVKSDIEVKKDDEIIKLNDYIYEIRVVPETEPAVIDIKGLYMPNLQFIKHIYNLATAEVRNDWKIIPMRANKPQSVTDRN